MTQENEQEQEFELSVETLFDKDSLKTNGNKGFWDRKSKEVIHEFNQLRDILNEHRSGKLTAAQTKKKVKNLRRMMRNPIFQIQSMDNRPT